MRPNIGRETKMKSLMSSKEKILLAETDTLRFLKQDNGIFVPYVNDEKLPHSPKVYSINSFGIWVFPLLYSFIDRFIGHSHFLMGEAIGNAFSRLGSKNHENDVLNTCLAIGEKQFRLLSYISEISQIGISFTINYNFVPGVFLVPSLYAIIPDSLIYLHRPESPFPKQTLRSGLGIIMTKRINKADTISDKDIVKYSVGLNRHPSSVIPTTAVPNDQSQVIYNTLNHFIYKHNESILSCVFNGDQVTDLNSAINEYHKSKLSTKTKFAQIIIDRTGVYLSNYDTNNLYGVTAACTLKSIDKKNNDLKMVSKDVLELLMDGNTKDTNSLAGSFGSVSRSLRCSNSLNVYFAGNGDNFLPDIASIKKVFYSRYGYMKNGASEMQSSDDMLRFGLQAYISSSMRGELPTVDWSAAPSGTAEEPVSNYLLRRVLGVASSAHSLSSDRDADSVPTYIPREPAMIATNYASNSLGVRRALHHFGINPADIIQVGVYLSGEGQLYRFLFFDVGMNLIVQGMNLVAIEFYYESNVSSQQPCLTLTYRTIVRDPFNDRWYIPSSEQAYDSAYEFTGNASFHEFNSDSDVTEETVDNG